jgi:hypothetical protein
MSALTNVQVVLATVQEIALFVEQQWLITKRSIISQRVVQLRLHRLHQFKQRQLLRHLLQVLHKMQQVFITILVQVDALEVQRVQEIVRLVERL